MFKIGELTIKMLGSIITGDGGISPYRSGPDLIQFFNPILSRDDQYGQGFPSRWYYAEMRLQEANELGKIKEVIENAFDPRVFLGTEFDIELAVNKFNKYLEFDDYHLSKVGKFYKLNSIHSSSVHPKLFDNNQNLNKQFIHEHLQKCDNKIKNNDYSGAITNARSLVENVLLELEQHLSTNPEKYDGDINKLYKRVYKLLNLDPSREDISEDVKQIFSGLISIVNGLAALRNKTSDAHAAQYNPPAYYAIIATNSAKTLTDFLVNSYEYKNKNLN